MSSSRHKVFVRRSSSSSLSSSPSASLNRRRPLLERNHAHSSSSGSLSSLSTSTSISSRTAILPATSKTVVKKSAPACCSGRFGEIVGGTAAECAAICCCCPCGLVNLLFLAIYKLPAGLCRRAIRRKRRERLIKKGLLPARSSRRCRCGCDDTDIHLHPTESRLVDSSGEGGKEWLFLGISEEPEAEENRSEADAMARLEKEMWETFYGTGFWRSPSQREAVPPVLPTQDAEGRPSRCSSPNDAKLL